VSDWDMLQEMIKRSREGQPNNKLSTWDYKTNSYICGIDLERAEARAKARLIKSKIAPSTNYDPNNPNSENVDLDDLDDKGSPTHSNDHSHSDASDNDDLLDPADVLPDAKRRKNTVNGANNRIIEVSRWVPVPVAVAEKMPEPKYLADRRPGMESLYKGTYRLTNGYGTLGPADAIISNNTTGYDLGDGTGLGTAVTGAGSGTLGGNQFDGGAAAGGGASTPMRKNIPPRRKKKGGPGRRPKNWKPPVDPNAPVAPAAVMEASTTNADGIHGGEGNGAVKDAMTTENTGEDGLPRDSEPGNEGANDAEGDGDGTDSEGEGSEEGEIADPVAVEEPVVPVDLPNATEQELPTVPAPAEAVETSAVEEVRPTEIQIEEVKQETQPVVESQEVDILGSLEAALDKEAEET
jgi:hypothetical protein